MAVCDSILECYGPAECRAIATHKYYLGLERGYDPPITEAVASWEQRFAFDWRSKKIRDDMDAQARAIERHRQNLAIVRGGDVTFADAARDWVDHHGAGWRSQREADATFDPKN